MRRRWIAFILFLLIAACSYAQEDSTAAPSAQTGRPGKSTTAAVFLSMGIPGGGQFYTHQYVKGVAAIVVEGAFGVAISYNNDRMHTWRKGADNTMAVAATYLLTGTRADSIIARGLIDRANGYRSNERFFKNQRNRLIWWLAGSILLSMGDAYVDAQLYGLDFSPNITYYGRAVGLSVACKF